MVKITGVKQHRNRLRQMRKVKNPIQKALVDAAGGVERDAENSIRRGAAGSASLPGQPPNNQTGALIAGITSGPLGDSSAHITSNDPGSAALEFGRSDAVERPFLRPAVQRNRRKITEAVARAVNVTVRRER